MALHANIGGTWKPLTAWVHAAGAWRKASVWLNVSGTWKQLTTLMSAQLLAASPGSTVSGSAATATLRLNSNGNFDCSTISNVITTQFAWRVSADASSAFEAVVTLDSGTLTTGSAGTFNLGTTRDWTVQKGTVGNASATITISIRPAGGGSNLASRQYTISATRSS